MHGVKHYGHYRGVVVDNNDPEGLGRVTLQVPQISGPNVTDWAWAVNGSPRQGKIPYGAFSDYTTQTPTANTPTAMLIGNVDEANNVSIVNGGQITFSRTGTYSFQWSGQFSNPSNTADEVAVWIRKNGTDVVGSTGIVTVPPKHGTVSGSIIAGWNFVFTLATGDYIELWWHTGTSGISLVTLPVGVSPTHPSTASLVVTATLVGNYIPNAGEGVWVTYEGGDINFPAWIGVF